MNSYHLARIGSLVAGGGIIWAVYSATQDVEMSPQFLEAAGKNVFMQSGPLEVCGLVSWSGCWASGGPLFPIERIS
jgi:hypothetical protein